MTQQRHALTNEQWQRMAVHLPAVGGRRERNNRLFIDAVLWIAITGAPWRDLPARLGAWAHVYQRFVRWSELWHFKGAAPGFTKARSRATDLGIDFFKVHQASAGAPKKWISSDWRLSWRAEYQIHAACDALGNPLRLKVTAGNKSDTPNLTGLIQSLHGQELLGDGQKPEVVIPPKANRNEKRALDTLKYQALHLVENLFQRVKIHQNYQRTMKISIRYFPASFTWLAR